MVAMLMVGTMVPVQQAAAQEISMEQQISMLQQISELMQIVMQLMAQLEIQQAAIGETPPVSVSGTLPQIFSYPNQAEYMAGGLMKVKWNQGDGRYTGLKLENMETGEKDFFRDTLAENRLYELVAPQEAGIYRLIAYRYYNISDSDDYVEYGVSRTFTVVEQSQTSKEDFADYYDDVEEDFEELIDEYDEFVDENYPVSAVAQMIADIETKLVDANIRGVFGEYTAGTEMLRVAAALIEETEEVLEDTVKQDDEYVHPEVQRVIDTLNNIGNKNNDDEAEEAIEDLEDDLEEYEEWYEDIEAEVADVDKEEVVEALLVQVSVLIDAAEDAHDDQDYDEVFELVEMGEEILDQLNNLLDDIEDGRFSTDPSDNELQNLIEELMEQVADQQDVPSVDEREDMSERELQSVISDLMEQIANEQGDGLNDSAMSQDFWDVDRNDAVFVVGAYQGTYPNGASRGFQQHPQGEITVNMTKQAGWIEDTMLVLTSYEPVKWVLTGDAVTDAVTRVFLSGYYDQEVVGISSDVEVIHMSHQSGDREYFYAYEENSRNHRELIDFLEDETDQEIYHFKGAYSLDEVSLGLKG
jgi:hypothetical protein